MLQASASVAESTFSAEDAGRPVAPCKKKTWIGIQLVDRCCQPVVGESYRITLPDGQLLDGKTDAKGTASTAGFDPGACQITFPELDRDAWRSGCDCPEQAGGSGAKATFIEFRLLDAAGQGVAGERFRVTHPDGTVHEGKLGPDGSVRYDGCPAGVYKVAFPDLDREAWVSADA
jgi:hypothetical protein